MWMDMDMDQVWSIFFIINFFSALGGVEIAFLSLLLSLAGGGEGIEYRSWTCSLFS